MPEENSLNQFRVPDGTTILPVPKSNTQGDEFITSFNEAGQKNLIAKSEWRSKVLPYSLKQHWNDTKKLYDIIAFALRDGFRADIIEAAEHLYQLDTSLVGSTCLWSTVLREESRLDEAEAVLKEYLERLGDNAWILLNLAQVYDSRKNLVEAKRVLWRALTLDPNLERAVGIYMIIADQEGGKPAAQTAMREITTLPGAWRALLWLARDALESKDLPTAIGLYREAIAQGKQSLPADLLMMVSGDLGKYGYLRESLDIVESRFELKMHGLVVGNNLIRAHLELGELKAAKALVDQLQGLNRPDWKKNLDYWETEIEKAK